MKIPLTVSENLEKPALTCSAFLRIDPRYRIGLKRVMFVIDTGCGNTLLTNQHAKLFGLPLTVEDRSPAFQLAGQTMKKKSLGVATLSFIKEDKTGANLKANPLYLALTTSNSQEDRWKAEQIPALIGVEFLKQNKLILHYDAGKGIAYLEKADSDEKNTDVAESLISCEK